MAQTPAFFIWLSLRCRFPVSSAFVRCRSAAITALVILNSIRRGLLPKGAAFRSKKQAIIPKLASKSSWIKFSKLRIAATKGFRQQENYLLVIYVSLQYLSLFLLFSLLCHLEKLDFSSVSTEAGHRLVLRPGSWTYISKPWLRYGPVHTGP